MNKKDFLGLICFLLLCAIARGQSCRCDTQEEDTYHQWYKVSAPSGLSLRKSPDKNAAKIDAIPFGEEVLACSITDVGETIEEKYGKWIKVSWADKIGYVFGGFLTEIQERKVHMIIPNAGVNSGWECMELDPAMKWEALVSTDTGKDLRNNPNPNHFRSAELKTGRKEMDADAESDCPGVLDHAVLNMPDPPFCVFSGFKLANTVYNQVSKPIKLMPGEVVNFETYDRANQINRTHTIAVQGNVMPNPDYTRGSNQGPVNSIEQYKIHLYEEEQLSSRANRNAPKKVQKLIDTTVLRPGDSDTFDMDVYYIYFAGDLDGDHQLDLILARLNGIGHSYHLYLSSKRLPGFLLRYVAMWGDAGC
jgi:hypothetical protein